MRVLITGGGGFLGTAIVRQLCARGDQVQTLSRRTYAHLQALGVRQYVGDLGDYAAVKTASAGCDVIVHAAAKAGVWGRFRDYYQTNVRGTEHILRACRETGVGRLVYTSSPSVTFAGEDQEGVDESAPYPGRFLAAYPQTKAEAEHLVLRANGTQLATVALRPHLIWGPGDPHLLPRLVERAQAGRLRRLGDRPNRVDATFIDNAASAHLLAIDHLQPNSPCAGQAYFIAQDEPQPLWEFINRLLAAVEVGPVKKMVPASVAYRAGATLELMYKFLPLPGEPPMTRFVARQLSTAHWFNLTAAHRDLGYRPTVSTEEGLEQLAQAHRDQRD